MDNKSVEMTVPRSESQKHTGRTGPRTAEGKGRTKNNAIRHGIFADIVLTSEPFRESSQQYSKLLRSLHKAIRPANGLEQTLVEQLAFEYFRLSRVYKADAQVTPLVFKRITHMLNDGKPLAQAELVEIDKGREVVILQKGLDPELVLRYGNSISKQIDRILDRLEHLQVARTSPLRE
jgi:hypothetical protein